MSNVLQLIEVYNDTRDKLEDIESELIPKINKINSFYVSNIRPFLGELVKLKLPIDKLHESARGSDCYRENDIDSVSIVNGILILETSDYRPRSFERSTIRIPVKYLTDDGEEEIKKDSFEMQRAIKEEKARLKEVEKIKTENWERLQLALLQEKYKS